MKIIRSGLIALWMAFAAVSFCVSGEKLGHCQDQTSAYTRIIKNLESVPFDVPIIVETHDDNSHASCNVYGIMYHDIESLRPVLRSAENWCDILLLHPNIKACTAAHTNKKEILTIYSGRKYYHPPEAALELELDFNIATDTATDQKIQLSGEKGPFHTKNYEILIHAVPDGQGRTFLHLRYTYDYGIAFSMALKTYLGTIGRRKIGFTIAGRDKKGNPTYVKGAQGVIERNAVRYYFSIQAFLETLEFPQKDRYKQRFSRYYDLTDQYPAQLYELDKDDYIGGKIKEHKNQINLQEHIETQNNP